MYIKTLDIANFRNYEKQSVILSDGLNVFMGRNAQGKTNLLEAVCLCSIGRSPRTPRDKELIRWDNRRARVKVEVSTRAGTESVDIVLDKAENKRVAVNSLPITRMGELMGVVSTVFFSPDEIKIVSSSPGERRQFMDIALCQISRAYFYTLQRYNKVLSQRNKLLKSGRATDESLEVWDMQLAESGAKIVKTRRGFIARLAPFADENHRFLTADAENLELSYEGVDGETLEEVTANFLKELKNCRERDLFSGFTGIGPQKDDMKITAGGIDVRAYGSQGQRRTAALSLKLAELDLSKSEKGDSPVLLLDDVLSELDKPRQQKLLQRTAGLQTILTCTHIDEEVFAEVKNYKVFTVENGGVTPSV